MNFFYTEKLTLNKNYNKKKNFQQLFDAGQTRVKQFIDAASDIRHTPFYGNISMFRTPDIRAAQGPSYGTVFWFAYKYLRSVNTDTIFICPSPSSMTSWFSRSILNFMQASTYCGCQDSTCRCLVVTLARDTVFITTQHLSLACRVNQ